MGIVDGLTVLAVLAAFGWLILARLNRKNPEAMKKTIGWFKSSEKPKIPVSDEWRQKYEEKRSIM